MPQPVDRLVRNSRASVRFPFQRVLPRRLLVSLTRCGLIVTLCLLAVFGRPGASVNAGDEWQPISQDELKMTSEPKAPGAPAIYLYRQVDRNDTARAGAEYNYVRIKILTEEGRKYGNVEIPFEKGRYDVAGIRAHTIRPDGSIVNFDGKIYENTIVKSKTNKYLAKTFTMPEAGVGSIVEYHFSYNFEDNYIFNSHWILSEELFTRHAQFVPRRGLLRNNLAGRLRCGRSASARGCRIFVRKLSQQDRNERQRHRVLTFV
jgi:Domain of Unknown Function with PDB structure (DUF3857)